MRRMKNYRRIEWLNYGKVTLRFVCTWEVFDFSYQRVTSQGYLTTSRLSDLSFDFGKIGKWCLTLLTFGKIKFLKIFLFKRVQKYVRRIFLLRRSLLNDSRNVELELMWFALPLKIEIEKAQESFQMELVNLQHDDILTK